MAQVTASLLCSPLLPSSTKYQNRVSSKSSSYRVSFNAPKSGSQIVSSKNVGSEAGLNGPNQNCPSVFKMLQMPLDIKTTYDAEKLRLDYMKCVPESCSQTVSSKSAGTEAGLNRPNQNRQSVYQYILQMPLKSRTDEKHRHVRPLHMALANEEHRHVRPLPMALANEEHRHVRLLRMAIIKTYNMEVVPLYITKDQVRQMIEEARPYADISRWLKS